MGANPKDWAHIKKQGKIWFVSDAESGWIEAFPTNDRTTLTLRKCRSAVFARFGVPKTLVSDNGLELVSNDFETWCRYQKNHKMESPIYHPRANGQAERAAQTVKLAIKAWGKHSSVIFCVFPTSTNGAWKNVQSEGENTMRTCSWTENQINYHRRFWRMRTNSLQAEQNTETQPAIFIIWCGINTSWIQPKRSERTVLVSDKQIARFSQETNTTDGTSDIVVIEIQCTMKMNNNQTINLNRSQTNLIDLQDSGNQRNTTEILYRQTFLEKEGRCDGLRSRPIWSAMQLICMGRCRRKS